MRSLCYLRDRLIARVAIWCLDYLYGTCEPPFDDDCLSCTVTRLIEKLRDI